MSQATIVRARQKTLEDFPEWKKCCEKARDIVRKQGELIVLVDPQTLMVGSSRCQHCGRIAVDKQFMKTAKKYKSRGRTFTVVAVDCFDFDEGPAEAAQ